MAIRAIVSYDDTPGDHDALILGKVLSAAGVDLVLAYVRHAFQAELTREQLEEHEAEALLERGARRLGEPGVERRVVLSGSTGEGLKWLAIHEQAELLVFGSDYRTPPGHIVPPHSAEILLAGGSTAIAFAPAGFSDRSELDVRTIGLPEVPSDAAATETAYELADRLGAAIVDASVSADLLVVGSRPEAGPGEVLLSPRAERAIEQANAPVLVVPRATPVRFSAPAVV